MARLYSSLTHSGNNIYRVLIVVGGLMVLSACTPRSSVRPDYRAPVSTPGGGAEVGVVSPDTRRRRVGRRSAVRALMRHSERQVRGGNLSKGAVFLQRALQIEPINPVLWNNMAGILFKQNKLALAEQYALKSNSFARGDRELKIRNWKLIAETRSLRGDSAGAEKAAKRVERLQ